MRFSWFLPVAMAALAGCADPGPADCGASGLSRYIGEPVVNVAAIETRGPTRILPPGAPRTAANPDRLTIVSGASGRVVGLYCG